MTKRNFRRLRREEWPPEDAALFAKSVTPSSSKLFSNPNPASAWSGSTLRHAEEGYGVYLGWLADLGLLFASETIRDRVSPERMERFSAAYAPGRSENTVATTIRGIAYILRACYRPKGPEWLSSAAYALTNEARPSRPKLPRLASIPELIGLGRRLMAEGMTLMMEKPYGGACLYRDGVMILFLAYRPARRGQLLDLKLGETLVNESGRWYIKRRKNANKKRGIEAPLSAELSAALEYYLEHVRPHLQRQPPGKDVGWLWLGRRGRLQLNSVTLRIGNLTEKHLGRRVTPHLFRDSVATDIALYAPEKIGITKSVLSHTQLKTSEKYYNQAASYSASAELDEALSHYEE